MELAQAGQPITAIIEKAHVKRNCKMRSKIVGPGSPCRRDKVPFTKNRFLLGAFLTSARKFYALRIILLLCDDVCRFPCDNNLLICWHDEDFRPAIGCGDFAFAGMTLISF